jgi:Lrp/AsnC family leucine-responsive transcriptional regulator
MSAKTEMDAIDRKILRVLTSDARSSYQAVADEVGLSRPAVMERVKRLEQAGFVRGYAALLDRAKAGFPITAFVAVRYASHDVDGNEPRVRSLVSHPGVLECHHVAGEDCYVLKIAAPDLDGVQTILRQLTATGGNLTTRTTIVLGTLFEKPGIMLPELD